MRRTHEKNRLEKAAEETGAVYHDHGATDLALLPEVFESLHRCGCFFPSQIHRREGADLENTFSERPRQDLPSGMRFGIGILPVVVISTRPNLKHPSVMARTRY